MRGRDAACDHGLEEPGQRPELPEQGEGASGMATGSVIPQPSSGSSNPSAAWGYLWLDRIVGAVTGYLAYRAQVTRCFFARPRLGHIWEGNSLERRCSRCPKVWIGNL